LATLFIGHTARTLVLILPPDSEFPGVSGSGISGGSSGSTNDLLQGRQFIMAHTLAAVISFECGSAANRKEKGAQPADGRRLYFNPRVH